jgi:streptogramin lyase
VDPNGNPWICNNVGRIFHWDPSTGKFVSLPPSGLASDVAVGADGTLWILGTNSVPGGYSIFKYTGSSWHNVAGGAVDISVDSNGASWIANNVGILYTYDPLTDSFDAVFSRPRLK